MGGPLVRMLMIVMLSNIQGGSVLIFSIGGYSRGFMGFLFDIAICGNFFNSQSRKLCADVRG